MTATGQRARAQAADGGAQDVPLPAAVYGGTGLIPLVATAIAVWVVPAEWAGFALDVQLFYGATIISFLGAAHWGLALAGQGTRGDDRAACSWARLGYSVAPSLVAWLSLITVPAIGLVMQMASFVATFFVDAKTTRVGITPAWYPRLRKPLTIVAILCLGASLIRTAQGL
jgi:hypothetical protein